MRFVLASICLALALVLVAPEDLQAQDESEEEQRVIDVLNELHDAASKADFDRYFGLYSSEAVFLGTDATERWSRSEFMDYARPHFDRGRGWTYTATERHVYVSDDCATAWFDERLDNESLGDTRGSGVLVRKDGDWKVAQYNLTIPIPNALASQFVEQIRSSADESDENSAAEEADSHE